MLINWLLGALFLVVFVLAVVERLRGEKTMTARKLGWVRDTRFDPRDEDYSFEKKLRAKMLQATPTFASVKDRVAEILDQGSLGSCTGCSVMQAVRIAHVGELFALIGNLKKALVQSVLGSILWAYYWGRVREHMSGVDAGAQTRDVISGLKALGVPPEALWPYSDDSGPDGRFCKFPSKDVFRCAVDQIGAYHRITSFGTQRCDDVMLALQAGMAVIAGWDVTETFCNEDPGGSLVGIPTAQDKIAGGHCMDIVEGSPGEVLICNSWGPNWGQGGFFRATWDWVETGEDLWVVDSSPLYEDE